MGGAKKFEVVAEGRVVESDDVAAGVVGFVGVFVVWGGVLCDSEGVTVAVLGGSVTVDCTGLVGSAAAQLRSAFSSVVKHTTIIA